MPVQSMILQEQQTEDSRLGSLIAIYQTQATRTGVGIFCGAILGVILFVGWFAFAFIWPSLLATGDFSLGTLLFSSGWTISPLIISITMVTVIVMQLKSAFFFVMPLHLKRNVWLYTDGLVYCAGWKRQVVVWKQISNVERPVSKYLLGWKRYYTLHLEGAPSIVLWHSIARLGQLGAVIEREIIKLRLPQMWADYKANRSIIFTGLCLSRDGISNSDEYLPWEAVECVRCDVEKISIKERRRYPAWLEAPMVQFRNVCLLEALLERIGEEQGFVIERAVKVDKPG